MHFWKREYFGLGSCWAVMTLPKSQLALLVAALAFAIACILSTAIAANAWLTVRNKPDTIEVTGSAKKRIVSNLIEWTATLEATSSDRAEAYRTLTRHVESATAYLERHGIKENEMRVSSASIVARYEREYVAVGDEAVSQQRLVGYMASQTITVVSEEVEKVEKVSRQITELLDQNVPVESQQPRYHYTKIGELKVEMLAEASADARERAENILRSAGGASLGTLVKADMGVININPAHSTSTSWEGNNDKTALEKDIITIVHVTYELEPE